jgi:exopolyphosphatase/guanosine-5'-triphosphate,3'-diphosphate pyrophosphatase
MITCDLGSNTLRILEFDCTRKQRLKEFEKVVRTAKDLYKTSIICEESKRRILDALSEASGIFDFASQEVFAVTTEAMRRANNSDDIIQAIKEKFGIEFQIIDGDEEARLTLLGIESGLEDAKISCENYCMIDLGGASTEVSFKDAERTYSKSFSFGIVTTAEKYENLDNIQSNIQNVISPVLEFIAEYKIDLKLYTKFVATAGTPTTVAAFMDGINYQSYDYKKINGKVLHVNDFQTSLERLLQLKEQEREYWVGTNRSDLVCAGILIIKNIMNAFGYSECIVIDNGLREGLAIAKCNRKLI